MGRHLNGSAAQLQTVDQPPPSSCPPTATVESEEVADLWSPPGSTGPLPIADNVETASTQHAALSSSSPDHLIAAWMGALAHSDLIARQSELIALQKELDDVQDPAPGADQHAPPKDAASQAGNRDADLFALPDGVTSRNGHPDTTATTDPGAHRTQDTAGDPDSPPVDDASPAADTRRPAGTTQPDADDPTPDDVTHGPASFLAAPTNLRPPSPHRRLTRRSTLIAALISFGGSALAGMAVVLLITQFTQQADSDSSTSSSHGGASTADVDDRVMVPGVMSGCVTMLVKPRPDGTTENVSGTCFAVG
jgi:hypothetical protein